MRLATLNVRYGTAEDGEFAWPHRKKGLIDALHAFDADIICLQEVLAFQLDEISSALTGYAWIGVGREDGRRAGEFAPIFYHQALHLRDSGTLWLSDTPTVPGSMAWGANHPRICTWAAFDKLTVANVHLDHESELARRMGCLLVLRKVPAEVICGDFNATPDEACIQSLAAAGYRDLADGEGTFNGFQPKPANPPKIDYVLARNPITGEAIVIRDRMVSDHWAVVADISLD